MPAQYTHLDGRRFVNADFVEEVREAYPATTKKIPLGYSTYTGWTGKDEVLFTEHHPLDDLVKIEGQVYEVTFDPSHPECFEKDILEKIRHTVLKGKKTKASRNTAHQTEVNEEERLRSLSQRRAFVQRILDEHKTKEAAENTSAASKDWIAWDVNGK